MKFQFEIEIEVTKPHKPVVSSELESVIERAAYDAIDAHLDSEDLDVSVQEA